MRTRRRRRAGSFPLNESLIEREREKQRNTLSLGRHTRLLSFRLPLSLASGLRAHRIFVGLEGEENSTRRNKAWKRPHRASFFFSSLRCRRRQGPRRATRPSSSRSPPVPAQSPRRCPLRCRRPLRRRPFSSRSGKRQLRQRLLLLLLLLLSPPLGAKGACFRPRRPLLLLPKGGGRGGGGETGDRETGAGSSDGGSSPLPPPPRYCSLCSSSSPTSSSSPGKKAANEKTRRGRPLGKGRRSSSTKKRSSPRRRPPRSPRSG